MRLVEQYRPGDRVEIFMDDGQGERWWSGRVVRLDHPGVWVQTENGYQWFVTNQRRIRRQKDEGGGG